MTQNIAILVKCHFYDIHLANSEGVTVQKCKLSFEVNFQPFQGKFRWNCDIFSGFPLQCSQCNGDPIEPKLLRRCGHTLCGACADAFPGGTCPIPGCGKYTQRNEIIPDRNTVVRWGLKIF